MDSIVFYRTFEERFTFNSFLFTFKKRLEIVFRKLHNLPVPSQTIISYKQEREIVSSQIIITTGQRREIKVDKTKG